MAKYTSGNATFDVYVQGDDITSGGYANHFLAYRRSKTMMRINSAAGVKLYTIGLGTRRQTYFTDAAGKLEIPVKGWLEALAVGTPTLIGISQADYADPSTVTDTITMYVTVVEGVAYVDNPAPLEKGLPSAWSSWAHRPDAVVLPNVMHVYGGGSYNVMAEANMPLLYQEGVAAYEVVGGVTSNVNATGSRGNQLIFTPAATEVGIGDKSLLFPSRLADAEDCEQLVMVRWTSLTGAIRQHYFPVIGYVRGSDKGVTLVSDADGYLSRRDATLALRCRITGLTAYSLWYYADLVQASDVHATTDFINAPSLIYDDTAVNVEDTAVDIADGSGFHAFEFTIKTKHYDTF